MRTVNRLSASHSSRIDRHPPRNELPDVLSIHFYYSSLRIDRGGRIELQSGYRLCIKIYNSIPVRPIDSPFGTSVNMVLTCCQKKSQDPRPIERLNLRRTSHADKAMPNGRQKNLQTSSPHNFLIHRNKVRKPGARSGKVRQRPLPHNNFYFRSRPPDRFACRHVSRNRPHPRTKKCPIPLTKKIQQSASYKAQSSAGARTRVKRNS